MVERLMIEPNNYNYSTSKEINETPQFASELELSVLPVILEQIDLDGVPAKEFCSNELSRTEGLEINPNDPEGVLANLLAKKFSGILVFCKPYKSWFYYNSSCNYWVSYEDSQTEGLIMDAIDESAKDKGGYSSNKIAGIRRLLKSKLLVSQLSEEDPTDFLPLQNGAMHLLTQQLHPHHPKFGFTYQLPYKFDDTADCQPIKDWLLESTGGDALQVEVLRAYLNAILKSRTDLQRYLEIIGVGGSGKSTYVHLAEALVGFENSFSTKLEAIEGNRFEVAGIIGKKLVTINDSEAYGGSVSTLKAITGQDAVRLEIKGKQQGDTFVPSSMVILTSNTSIRSSDYTSGLQRRRLTIYFNQAVSPENMRNLISLRNGIWSGEFVSYLPGLLNWVLEMSDQDVTRLVKDTSTHVPSLELVQREALRNSNPLAEWFDESVVFAFEAKTYVGDKQSNSVEFLFNNYVNHCQNCGTNAVALNKFSNSVVDLCNNQLKQEVEKNRDNKGVYLTGIRLRKQTDINSPTPITGQVFNSPTEQQMEQNWHFQTLKSSTLKTSK